MAKARYEYVYTVRGTWSFPIDMFRYDLARPATEADSGQIERSMNPRERPANGMGWSITIRGDREPTVGRWESFGWKVIDVEKRRVA